MKPWLAHGEDSGSGPDAAVVLPRLVLGTASLPVSWRRFELRRQRDARALLDLALECGCGAVDVAAVYGHGVIEQVVGDWLRARRLSGRVLVIGKGGHPDGGGLSRVHPAFVAQDLDASLRRLRVDAIDLYMLHRDDETIPVGVIMTGLHRFVQAGKVRALGASNWSHARIEAANLFALSHGLTAFTASSPQFSLAEMSAPPWPGCLSIGGDGGAAARAWYAANRLPVLAWSPLGAGFLAGRAELDEATRRAYDNERNRARRDRVAQLARERGAAPSDVALGYLFAQPFDVHPVVAARSPERLRALLAAPSLTLSARDVAWLEHGERLERPQPRGHA